MPSDVNKQDIKDIATNVYYSLRDDIGVGQIIESGNLLSFCKETIELLEIGGVKGTDIMALLLKSGHIKRGEGGYKINSENQASQICYTDTRRELPGSRRPSIEILDVHFYRE